LRKKASRVKKKRLRKGGGATEEGGFSIMRRWKGRVSWGRGLKSMRTGAWGPRNNEMGEEKEPAKTQWKSHGSSVADK